MKIAICLAGYLRTFKECYSSLLENVIQNHDCDIFMHTYENIGTCIGWVNDVKVPIQLNDEKIDMNFIENIPNLKLLAVQKWDDIKYIFDKYKKYELEMPLIMRMIGMLYKIYLCNELKKKYELENNFKYDLVIRTRPDNFYTKKVDLFIPKDKILINYYPWGDDCKVYRYVPGFIESLNKFSESELEKQLEEEKKCLNDRFAAGDSDIIDYLSDLYLNIDTYLEGKITYEHIYYEYLKTIQLERRKLAFYTKR